MPSTEGCSCASACRLSPIAIAAVAVCPPLRAAATPSSSRPPSSAPASSPSAPPPTCRTPRRSTPRCCRAWRARTSPPSALADRADGTNARLPQRGPRRAAKTKLSADAGRGRRLAAAARRVHLHLAVRDPLGQAARRHRPGRPGGHAVQGRARRHGDPGGLQRRLRLLASRSRTTTAPRSSTPTPGGCWCKQGDKVKAGQVDRRGRQHRRLVRDAPAPRDPRGRPADRPDPVPARAWRRHQAPGRVGLRGHGRRLLS